MADIPSQPSSPAQWKQYANSNVLSTLPSSADERQKDESTFIQRGVYLDVSELNTSAQTLYVYSDVIAFTEEETTISPAKPYSDIHLVARVFTAATPINLKIVPVTGCEISLYVDILDKPITVSAGSAEPVLLELGAGTENRGVLLRVSPDEVHTEYKHKLEAVKTRDFRSCLETQLRIALVLFWSHASIAISLCAFVAKATAKPPAYPQINTQAVALGQQLASQAMTGPKMGYAPVLQLDEYSTSVRDALDAVAAFEEQWDRFEDKKESSEIQEQAWATMLQLALNEEDRRKLLSDLALEKYQYASGVVSNCHEQFDADTDEIEEAKTEFQNGLDDWKHKQSLLAVFKILGAIIGFAVGIGSLLEGEIAGIDEAIRAINEAVDAVDDAEKLDNQEGKKISSGTLENLGNAMKALAKLYPDVESVVEAIQQLESDPNADIPSIGDISGTNQGDADAAAIVALAAWDKWVLESDQQMEFAVGEDIGGASEYRTVLRKHAVNGKQLAQAQTEAIKAGQEYVQAEMDVIVCMQDIDELRNLQNQYENLADYYAESEAKFYDRFLAMRTGVAIEMRNMVWAYKYWTLEDSRVVLDSQKSTADFRSDLVLLDAELEVISGKYATDFQPFNFLVPSRKLPSNYGPLMIQGLQSDSHTANFSLEPSTSPNDDQSFASTFVEGSHFRLEGLEAVLRGVVPQPNVTQDGVVQVDLQILTSGAYADVQDGEIFNFTSLPRSVRFSYNLTESGDKGDTLIHASFPTGKYAEFTPFTQWTIKLLRPELLDLSGLTGVDLFWSGNARFDEPGRPSQGVRLPKRGRRLNKLVRAGKSRKASD